MSRTQDNSVAERGIIATTIPSLEKQHSMAEHPSERYLETCVICLSTFETRAIAYPCNHLSFDFACLSSWLQHKQTCPLCNTPVTRVEYDWRSAHDYKTFIPVQQRASAAAPRRPQRPPPFRQQPRRHPAPPAPAAQSDLALERRRLVYARECFSLHRAPSRPTAPVTPAMFRASHPLQSKARLFLRRELRVFTFMSDTPSRTEFVLEYIVGMLCRLEMKGADGAMENLLAEMLGRPGAKLLIHELSAWLHCAFDRLEDWDRFVQYADREVMRFDNSRAKTGE